MNAKSLLACAPFFVLAACGKKTEANTENFTKGMIAYLDKRGDLCLGKSAWPVDVTEREFAAGARNAVQMPVLERLSLVRSSDAMSEQKTEDGVITVKVKRYELTDAGRAYYLTRQARPATADGRRATEGDFCAARLTLDKVVGWETSKGEHGEPTAVVTYTYQIDAAPWTQDPEVKRVFPAVDGVVRGARSARLKEGFTLTSGGWVANELLEGAASTRDGGGP